LIKEKINIIGGGAAGFFAAINIALNNPTIDIEILEKSTKLLSKVKISGGGRCNVTHNCHDNTLLIANYPRGNKELKQLFAVYNVSDTISWFERQGIKLKIEEDGRMFPYSNDSQTIIDCFFNLCEKLNIKITTQCEVFAIKQNLNSFEIKTNRGILISNKIICCIGGHYSNGHYQFIKNLGHTINEPIPSLFTFNLNKHPINKSLQGVTVANVEIKLNNFKSNGALLITHWGFSGPAVLKLSAFAAKELSDCNYNTIFTINWLGGLKLIEIESLIFDLQKNKSNAMPYSNPLNNLPKRLWEFLCNQVQINNEITLGSIPKKQLIKLAETIYRNEFTMHGKTTFKEEFVTCGGINLKEIDFKTMQSKLIPGLYFCGEVIDVDGVTGGFNFQNAWSTAWVCAKACSNL
jgi:predicted Rossmann fold flavoprotein